MSFMKARQVVQTSVLSKRWTHLWRSVPCLDLDADDAEFRVSAPEEGGDTARKFVNIVDNLLLFHEASTLDTFRLHFGTSRGDQKRDADRWIRQAIKYAPSVLELHLRHASYYSRAVRLPGLGTCSRRLKWLHLSCVSLDASFSRQIQFGCPILEDLKLNSCYCTFHEITSHTLKTLTITGPSIFNIPDKDDRDRGIIIMVPALVTMHLIDCDPHYISISVKAAANLVQASISLLYNNCKDLCKLLDGLTSVRNLGSVWFRSHVERSRSVFRLDLFGSQTCGTE